jgi:hypothetical protein
MYVPIIEMNSFRLLRFCLLVGGVLWFDLSSDWECALCSCNATHARYQHTGFYANHSKRIVSSLVAFICSLASLLSFRCPCVVPVMPHLHNGYLLLIWIFDVVMVVVYIR